MRRFWEWWFGDQEGSEGESDGASPEEEEVVVGEVAEEDNVVVSAAPAEPEPEPEQVPAEDFETAVASKNFNRVLLLIDAGEDITGEKGDRALRVFCAQPDVVVALVRHGVRIAQKKDPSLAQTVLCSAVRSGKTDVVISLTEAGWVNINSPGIYLNLPPVFCVRSPDMIPPLVKLGADLNQPLGASGGMSRHSGMTPLTYFISTWWYENIETIRRLISCGADPRREDKNGMTPMMTALRLNCKIRDEVVQLLIDVGVIPEEIVCNKTTLLKFLSLPEPEQDLWRLLKSGVSVDTWTMVRDAPTLDESEDATKTPPSHVQPLSLLNMVVAMPEEGKSRQALRALLAEGADMEEPPSGYSAESIVEMERHEFEEKRARAAKVVEIRDNEGAAPGEEIAGDNDAPPPPDDATDLDAASNSDAASSPSSNRPAGHDGDTLSLGGKNNSIKSSTTSLSIKEILEGMEGTVMDSICFMLFGMSYDDAIENDLIPKLLEVRELPNDKSLLSPFEEEVIDARPHLEQKDNNTRLQADDISIPGMFHEVGIESISVLGGSNQGFLNNDDVPALTA